MRAMDARRKRARFRAWRRGFREIDLIMGGFADQHIAALDDAQIAAFEQLLDAPDQDVYAWITNAAPAPAAFDTDTLRLIKSYRYFARMAAPS